MCTFSNLCPDKFPAFLMVIARIIGRIPVVMKSRTNRELEELSKGENIVKWIKGQRVSWLGHLERRRRIGCPKRSSLKNWKGRDEEEDPRKDREKK
jgi:hypothetical protein